MKPVTRAAALLLVFLGLFPSPAAACRCTPQSPAEDFAEVDTVFSGTVAAVTVSDLEVHAFVDWLEAWKGDLPAGTLVRVVSADSSAACGYPFQEGEELVIFALTASGHMETNTCTHTGRLTRVEALNAFGPPESVNPLNVELRRGNVNGDGEINIADPISSLLFQFIGTFKPPCMETLDFDGDRSVELADAIAALGFLFRGGPPPVEPFTDCGKDRDPAPLDCARYPPCPPTGDRHEVVRIERVGEETEIEVYSTRPFQPRALLPILCIGTQSTFRSRAPMGGGLNTLIFTFSRDAFDAIQGSQLVTVQHGDRCLEELDQQRLYWDLWVFGRLEF